MAEANPHRGEVKVDLAGREIVLRPTFEAMAEIETVLGERLVPITRRVGANNYGAMDFLAIILAAGNAGLRAGEKLQPDAVKNAIAEKGLVAFATPVSTFLANCLTGGAKKTDDEPGEARAAAGT